MSYPKIPLSEILGKESGFVGTGSGLVWFIKKKPSYLEERSEYEYSDSHDRPSSNWISVYDFQQIYNWKMYGTPPIILWDRAELDAKILYKILLVCSSQPLYVGVGGGLDALKRMKKEVIASRSFQTLTTDDPPKINWVKGNDFRKVMDEVGF